MNYYDTDKLPYDFASMTKVATGSAHWDYFQAPERDWIFSVAKTPGCKTSHFGNRAYLRMTAPLAGITLEL